MKKIIPTIYLALLLTCAKAEWQPTSGPVGGRINCIVRNGPNMFVGIQRAGVYISSDNGSTWTRKSYGIKNLDVQCLAFVGGKLLAGTGFNNLYSTSNNGNSWTEISTSGGFFDAKAFIVNGSKRLP